MTSPGQDRIPAGYVRRAHGIGGDVVVRGMLTDAAERFVEGSVFLTNEDEPRSFTVVGTKDHQGDIIVSFAGVTSRNDAESLRGVQFTIAKADRRELEHGEWWPEDLIGCTLVTTKGGVLGKVIDVVTGAAQDRLVVETSDGVAGEVPFVSALVPEVSIADRRIVVDLPDGLFT